MSPCDLADNVPGATIRAFPVPHSLLSSIPSLSSLPPERRSQSTPNTPTVWDLSPESSAHGPSIALRVRFITLWPMATRLLRHSSSSESSPASLWKPCSKSAINSGLDPPHPYCADSSPLGTQGLCTCINHWVRLSRGLGPAPFLRHPHCPLWCQRRTCSVSQSHVLCKKKMHQISVSYSCESSFIVACPMAAASSSPLPPNISARTLLRAPQHQCPWLMCHPLSLLPPWGNCFLLV